VPATRSEQSRRLDPVPRRPDLQDKPGPRRTVDNARAAESTPAIHIDTIEVKVEAPIVQPAGVAPPPPQRKPADRHPAPARLARGFATTIGLRQA
jgi:hypothetical protein